ncbi:MAG TPA: hypothetical protein VG939_13935 [Caulobacteraceae bacterium]|nr:hypothetical protein [Caulobacteraceae bacterium]
MRADDLIDGEHSRATWARARMGPELAAAFDADLREVLGAAEVEFRVETRLLWGRARAAPRPQPAA